MFVKKIDISEVEGFDTSTRNVVFIWKKAAYFGTQVSLQNILKFKKSDFEIISIDCRFKLNYYKYMIFVVFTNHTHFLNSLPQDKILGSFKLKTLADN